MGEPVFCSRQRVSAGPPPAIPLGKTAVQAAATERRHGQSRARARGETPPPLSTPRVRLAGGKAHLSPCH